ncbi:hypothetical protein ACP4OV_018576 [Aristida adscensionis]
MVAGAADDGAAGLKVVAGAGDGAGSPAEPRIVVTLTPADEPLPPPAAAAGEVLLVDMEGMMNKATESVENQVSTTRSRIHRFPHHLRDGIGGTDGRYVVPSVVAIGPYHHDKPHLQAMEDFKRAVALRLCKSNGRSVQEVYKKILSVADDARRCYDASAVAALSDGEFADMMFFDGCFLLWFMADDDDQLLTGCAHSAGPSFMRDLFLLENQVPWLVLEALMEFLPVGLYGSVAGMVCGDPLFFPRYEKHVLPSWIMRLLIKCRRAPEDEDETDTDEESRPLHLLGLLRFILIQSLPHKMRKSTRRIQDSGLRSLTISAVDMAQKGVKVKLAASNRGLFAPTSMSFHAMSFFGKLTLSPMVLDDTTACWLVNLAALEAVEGRDGGDGWFSDGYVVSSYLSLLAMLMDRVEDVHELRRSGVLRSRFCDMQTLTYFKGMGQHLRLGYNYFNTLADIEDYMRRRPVRIAVHKFLYNNYRIVAAVLSIAGVLVGIFKALYSLKRT